ncbi:MAG: PLDc_N domain-containing protein [Ardenticatenaceae bacterium]|nr:PLDc_N domain-containing protein [Ardenticatenaceae bacterium]MCB8947365.1 PLDc_N domain-containing protein [Ardenticatenaceae bacterium]
MEFITNNLPLLIPIILIQLTLVVFALADLLRRENTRGPKWVWVLVILFVNMIGPIIYFLVGRDEA